MRAPTLLVAFLVLLVLRPEMAGAQQATVPVPQAGQGAIAAAQQQLNQEGYPAGPVNGVMTEQTRRAVAAYERRTGRVPEALAAAGGSPVKQAQAGLRRLGLFAGPIDGTLGAQSRDAIIRFEASRQLPIDPRVSDHLLAEIEQAATASASATSAAAAAAPEPTPPRLLGRRQLPAWENPPPIR